MTSKEHDILKHALCGGGNREYRNHFVTGPGSDDYDACMSLVERGLMLRHNRSLVCDPIFVVTELGRVALKKKVERQQ